MQPLNISVEYFTPKRDDHAKDTEVLVYQWMAPGLRLETKVFLEAKTSGSYPRKHYLNCD
jgi:hypothetical protein